MVNLLFAHLGETTAERDAARHELEKMRAEIDALSKRCEELAAQVVDEDRAKSAVNEG